MPSSRAGRNTARNSSPLAACRVMICTCSACSRTRSRSCRRHTQSSSPSHVLPCSRNARSRALQAADSVNSGARSLAASRWEASADGPACQSCSGRDAASCGTSTSRLPGPSGAAKGRWKRSPANSRMRAAEGSPQKGAVSGAEQGTPRRSRAVFRGGMSAFMRTSTRFAGAARRG